MENLKCHSICARFEKVSNAFTIKKENFRQSYIFENAKIMLNLAHFFPTISLLEMLQHHIS